MNLNLKRFLDENELDLSLQDLESVPVKKILELRKVTILDLSCNLLHELPEDFGTLSRLVKLDLSKNRLETLPSSFGDLFALQHLDLRDNKIAKLPPCFGRLRRLRWLDLKGNPLTPKLQEVAGDCVSQTDCQRCAQNMVAHMRQVATRMEEERKLRLEQERQNELLRREAQLAEKRAAKEERRQAYQRRLAEANERAAIDADNEAEEERPAEPMEELTKTSVRPQRSSRVSCSALGCIFIIMALVALAFALTIGRHRLGDLQSLLRL